MRVRTGAIFAVVAAAAAVAATPAVAAETRAQFVAEADAVCKQAIPEAKRVARKYGPLEFEIVDPDNPPEPPTKQEIRKEIRKLTRLFGGLNRVFGRMVTRIAFIPIPTGDERAVTSWISGMRAYRRLSDRSNQALKRGQFGKWLQRLIRSLEALQNGANSVVGFGFRHCPAGDLIEEFQASSRAARAYAQASGS